MSELKRLANLLTVAEEDLSFLAPLETEQLQFLYASVDNAMHMQQAPLWSGLVRATHLLLHPAWLAIEVLFLCVHLGFIC
ncbi:MAG: hypothetical protein GY796_20725 [Chloroflexi bacterium]|nr:hypothetical protein [Chloroflexota bacterium]